MKIRSTRNRKFFIYSTSELIGVLNKVMPSEFQYKKDDIYRTEINVGMTRLLKYRYSEKKLSYR